MFENVREHYEQIMELFPKPFVSTKYIFILQLKSAFYLKYCLQTSSHRNKNSETFKRNKNKFITPKKNE